jgi:outer membrane biosynthesis protein TonB
MYNSHSSARLTLGLAFAACLSLPVIAAQLSATQPAPPTQTTPQPPPVPRTTPPRPRTPTTAPQPPDSPPPPAPTPSPTQAPAPPPTTGTPTGDAAQVQNPPHTTPNGGATVLLDRISEIVDSALQGKKGSSDKDKGKDEGNTGKADNDRKGTSGATGTSGVLKIGKTPAGSVMIERAALDEIRAEVAQLKILLSDKRP